MSGGYTVDDKHKNLLEGEEVQAPKNREGEEKMAERNVWIGFYSGCRAKGRKLG